MKAMTPELLVDTSFRLIADRADDPARIQAEHDRAAELIERLNRAQLSLPITGNERNA
jgi:hypothetical protein